MKKSVYFLLFAMLLTSCLASKESSTEALSESHYLIKKIQKKNSWYIIYMKRKDTLYKIVSKIDTNFKESCNKIVVGKSYNFDLHPRKDNAPIIGGVKLDPVGFTGCYNFDNRTTICLEPKKGIYELFYTNDLKGICYSKL
ncbi:MAG: hypothetical protein V4541_07110 [Bacteroidota bacterium]